ncbi:hypothetical protein ACMGE7_02010 [Macrococcus equi]|uniref:hypothetical protein n=1 Tax=Macrococcus equi TaxID=3395462 RepID=UPI0039BE9806
MKKTLSLVTISTVLLSGAFMNETAQADGTGANINYASKAIAKKAMAGTLTMDGFKIGTKYSSYLNRNDIWRDDLYRVYDIDPGAFTDEDFVMADFQNKVSMKKRVITRIVDKYITNKRTISRSTMLKVYGKPLKTERLDAPRDYDKSKIVDMYKNITFFYEWESRDGFVPKLEGAVIMHNKTKSAQNKWFNYATGQAGYSTDYMEKYISSSEWAGY